jgi:ABC-type glycerol-3-phosphate transport system substrate-binding protein
VRRLLPAAIAAALLTLFVTACGADSSSTGSASLPPAGGDETVTLAVPSSMRGGELSDPAR